MFVSDVNQGPQSTVCLDDHQGADWGSKNGSCVWMCYRMTAGPILDICSDGVWWCLVMNWVRLPTPYTHTHAHPLTSTCVTHTLNVCISTQQNTHTTIYNLSLMSYVCVCVCVHVCAFYLCYTMTLSMANGARMLERMRGWEIGRASCRERV